MAIDPISAKALASAIQKPGAANAANAGDPASQTAAGSFSGTLSNLIASVDESAGTANEAINGMVSGTGDVHHAMLALQRAETMFQLTVQVRNKLVQAYQDVMRMPM